MREVKWTRMRIFNLVKIGTRKLPCVDGKVLFLYLKGVLKEFGAVHMNLVASKLLSCDSCMFKTLGSYSLTVNLVGQLDTECQATAWKPLGEIGTVKATESILRRSGDNTRQPNIRGEQRVHRVKWDDCIEDMTRELSVKGCIEQVDDDRDLTCTISMRPKPHSDKALLICDRALIANEGVAATKFKLPNTRALMGMKGNWWFTKLDLANAFWSIHLPDNWADKFIFGFHGPEQRKVTYRLKCLPFGWNRSPWVLQQTVNEFIKDCKIDEVYILQYMDNILSVALDPDLLRDCTAQLAGHLEEKGLVVSKSEGKCVYEPCQSITWLGKLLEVVEGYVTVRPTKDAMLEVLAIAGLAMASKRRQAVLSVLGVIAWLSNDTRRAFPFMQNLYKWCMWRGRIGKNKLILTCVQQVVQGLRLIAEPAHGTTFAMPQEVGLHTYNVLVFMDAAAVEGKYGVVTVNEEGRVKFWSIPLPRSMQCDDHNSQQLAELYAVKGAAGICLKEGLMENELLFLSDSQASIFTCLNLTVKAAYKLRGRVLRQLVRRLKGFAGLPLAFLPAGMVNPADLPSRMKGGFQFREFDMKGDIQPAHVDLWHKINFVLMNPDCIAYNEEYMVGQVQWWVEQTEGQQC